MNRSLLLPLLLVSAPAFAWGECEHSATREAAIDVGTARKLALATGAGDLRVIADAKATRATAVGKACASSEELLAAIQLVTRNDGGVPTIKADMPEYESSWLGNTYAYLDLEVRVPASVALTLSDSSGDVDVDGVASLDAHDSSGDLDVRGVAGEVQVTDSSGDVNVRDAGSVRIPNDSSGDLELSSIKGDVLVESDSSGDIDIDDVAGNAMVRSDSSGDIVFADVTGSATVDRDSSGGIRATGIGGDFIVRSDGSGGVSHSGVKGRVDVPDED
jgi:hypothetical protein